MYAILWMRDREEIAREQSGLKELDEVVRYARAKAATPVIHLIAGGTPDAFHILDDSGQLVAQQRLLEARGG